MIHHLLSTLERLEALLDDSIRGMTEKAALDDAALTSAKGRALLALTRLSGEIGPDALPEDVKAQIVRVRTKLAREKSLLERRLDASQLVIRLVADAVLAQDWDGTYGPVPSQHLISGRAGR